MVSFEELQNSISIKLTWEAFEKILKQQHNCEKVHLIDIKLGASPKKTGLSEVAVKRFSIEYSGEISGVNKPFELHVIAKTLQVNKSNAKEGERSGDFFRNEIAFYSEIWPELMAFQQEVKPKVFFRNIPKYFHGESDGINGYILIEDLFQQGYKSGLTIEGELTFETAKPFLKLFARFHSLVYAFKERKPDAFSELSTNFEEKYFGEEFRAAYNKAHHNQWNIFLNIAQQELPPQYSTKLKEVFSRDLYGEVIEHCASTCTSKWKVVSHGDIWLPNILIRRGAMPKKMHLMLIDFQLTRFASLAHDVHTFIYTCTDPPLWEEHYEDMLKYYIEEFNEFYLQFCPDAENKPANPLSYDALMSELRAQGNYPLCIVSMLLDYIANDNLTEGVKEESLGIEKALSSKENRAKFAQIIKHLIDNKFI